MRVPTDKPSAAASLKHRPLFTPLILPMLGFVAVLIGVIWLALAYQQTTTVVLAVWDDTAGNQSELFQLVGQVDVDATYAVGHSPFDDMALILPGDPMPARPLDSIPAMVNNIDNGSLLLLVIKSDFDAVMAALDVEYAAPVDAGMVLVITVPTLGQASILRILPGEELSQD